MLRRGGDSSLGCPGGVIDLIYNLACSTCAAFRVSLRRTGPHWCRAALKITRTVCHRRRVAPRWIRSRLLLDLTLTLRYKVLIYARGFLCWTAFFLGKGDVQVCVLYLLCNEWGEVFTLHVRLFVWTPFRMYPFCACLRRHLVFVLVFTFACCLFLCFAFFLMSQSQVNRDFEFKDPALASDTVFRQVS